MTEPMGLLISSFDYSPVAEDEFHDWYDMEHIPERARIPGFVACTRWLAVDLPKVSLNTYELDGIDVLRSPGYLAVGYENNSPWTRRVGWRCIKRLRFEGVQAVPGRALPSETAEGLVAIALNGRDGSAILDPMIESLSTRPGVLCARRFAATASTHAHVLLVHIEQARPVADGPLAAIAAELATRQAQGTLSDLLITSCVRYRRGA